MEMFDFETTDLGDDDGLPVFERIGLENINDKRIENVDEVVYDIDNDEIGLLDADGEIELDNFNDQCIELDDFMTMEIFDLETTDFGDVDELPVFETIRLKDVSDKRISDEDEEASAINDVEVAVLDSDTKIKVDDFSGKCIEFDDFVAMKIFDPKVINLDDDDDDNDELLVFETLELESVNDKRIADEDEAACGINGVEAAVLDSDAKIKSDDFSDK